MNSTNINSEFEFEFKMEIQNGKEKEIKKRGREATWASDPISAQNPLLTRVSRPIPPQPLGLTLTDMWTRGSAFYASRAHCLGAPMTYVWGPVVMVILSGARALRRRRPRTSRRDLRGNGAADHDRARPPGEKSPLL
jgi:hypothetical protein